MQLKFPLHYYDEAGRLKPPLFLFVGLAFFCRPLLVLIIALSLRDQSDTVMRLFYPSKQEFYWSLIPAAMASIVFLLIARRNSLWQKEKFWYFILIMPLTYLTLIVDISLQLDILMKEDFAFSFNKALSLSFSAAFFVFLLTNPHVKALSEDWKSDA